jgi:hypothetical protein
MNCIICKNNTEKLFKNGTCSFVCNSKFQNKERINKKEHNFQNSKKENCPVCCKQFNKINLSKHLKICLTPNFCLNCEKQISQKAKFCSSGCAAIYNNKHFKKERGKIINVCCKKCSTNISVKSGTVRNNFICINCKEIKIKKCKWCGISDNKKCKRIDICHSNSVLQLIKSMIKYFGFDKNVIGSEKIYFEYDRIKNSLLTDYFINKLSTTDLQKKYNCLNQRVYNALKFFTNGNLRTLSQANSLANTQHKGWIYCKHITWNNKIVYLRSSYEEHYANLLDKEKIIYDVECLRVNYFDTVKNQKRIAVPDFYISKSNTIVEIKSTWTLDVQNMKDKLKAYKKLGYEFKLILNKKEVDLNSLN